MTDSTLCSKTILFKLGSKLVMKAPCLPASLYSLYSLLNLSYASPYPLNIRSLSSTYIVLILHEFTGRG